MKLAVLQLDNSVVGMESRLLMIENLISRLTEVDFVVLPELSTPGYIPNYNLWELKEPDGQTTKSWAVEMAKKYNIYIGCGYLDFSNGEYYNAYLIANKDGICGTVYKEQPEANIFKRGDFNHIIETPLGNIAVGICFDCHRECFYNGIKDTTFHLILMPHAWAMSVNDDGTVKKENILKIDFLGKTYSESFDVPVVFCNAIGAVDQMAGITGALMKDYKLMGQSSVYRPNSEIECFGTQESCIFEADISKQSTLLKPISFYGTYIDKGSKIFRHIVIPLDNKKGIRDYEKNKRAKQ